MIFLVWSTESYLNPKQDIYFSVSTTSDSVPFWDVSALQKHVSASRGIDHCTVLKSTEDLDVYSFLATCQCQSVVAGSTVVVGDVVDTVVVAGLGVVL